MPENLKQKKRTGQTHVLKDDIYGQVAVAYSAHRHKTTKKAVSHVTSLMQLGSHVKLERRAHAAVVREGTEEVEIEKVVVALLISRKPRLPVTRRTYTARQNTKSELGGNLVS